MAVVSVDKDWIQQLYLKEQMETNEIKKTLYKEKPKAILIGKEKDSNLETIFTYKSKLSSGKKILFRIPEEEAEGFEKQMESQLLIRWMENS